jgi:hypothetical protein
MKRVIPLSDSQVVTLMNLSLKIATDLMMTARADPTTGFPKMKHAQ